MTDRQMGVIDCRTAIYWKKNCNSFFPIIYCDLKKKNTTTYMECVIRVQIKNQSEFFIFFKSLSSSQTKRIPPSSTRVGSAPCHSTCGFMYVIQTQRTGGEEFGAGNTFLNKLYLCAAVVLCKSFD